MGTDAHATTPGTTENEVGGDEPPIRFRGDEPELYLAFNHELIRKVRSAVRADPADIEDACSFAWVQFFRYQPSREREWRGWLFRTAQREAWRLNAQHYAERPMLHDTDVYGVDSEHVPADPHDHYEERLEFQAALEELRKLPEHLRAVVLLNAALGRTPTSRGSSGSAGSVSATSCSRSASPSRTGPSAAPSSSAQSRHRAPPGCASSRTTRPSG